MISKSAYLNDDPLDLSLRPSHAIKWVFYNELAHVPHWIVQLSAYDPNTDRAASNRQSVRAASGCLDASHDETMNDCQLPVGV